MLTKKTIVTFSGALMLAAIGLNSATASSIEASLNNDTAQIEFDTRLSKTANLHVNASLLYTEEHSNHSALVGTVGFQGVESNNSTYRAAVGARLYFYDYGKLSGTAVAVGGSFYHTLPGARRFSAGGYGWFAPKVTSFGDTEQIYEAGARLAFRVIKNTDIFVGYRHLKVKNVKYGERYFTKPLEKGVNAGFRLNF